MTTAAQLFRVELNEDISLCWSEQWTCSTCLGHFYLVYQGQPPKCASCEFIRANKDKLMIGGWNLIRTGEQIVASRVAKAKLGS